MKNEHHWGANSINRFNIPESVLLHLLGPQHRQCDKSYLRWSSKIGIKLS